MRDKQVYDLTVDDLGAFGVWFFPMDESVQDEQTVRPLLEPETGADFQIIVRTRFSGADGSHYLGYVRWCGYDDVSHVQPVLFVADGTCVSFWSGMLTGSWNGLSNEAQRLRTALPLSYQSEPLLGLSSISGRLEGLYHLDTDSAVRCLA